MFAAAGAAASRVPAPNIPAAIVAQIREQARTAPRGMESVGRIVLGDQSARYEPLVNHATKRDQFRLADGELAALLAPGETPILVHTHPNRDDVMHPSRDDIRQANPDWRDKPYAVYLKRLNLLALFALNANGHGYQTLGLYR